MLYVVKDSLYLYILFATKLLIYYIKMTINAYKTLSVFLYVNPSETGQVTGKNVFCHVAQDQIAYPSNVALAER